MVSENICLFEIEEKIFPSSFFVADISLLIDDQDLVHLIMR